MTEPFWADIPNLRLAAEKLDEQGRKTLNILARMRANADGLIDPATFGVGDYAGDQFYPGYKAGAVDLQEGVDKWGSTVLATADGVRAMATMFEKADDSAEERAAAIERAMSTMAQPSAPPPVSSPGGSDSGAGSSGDGGAGGSGGKH